MQVGRNDLQMEEVKDKEVKLIALAADPPCHVDLIEMDPTLSHWVEGISRQASNNVRQAVVAQGRDREARAKEGFATTASCRDT